MVKSGEQTVTLSCIPIELSLIGCSTPTNLPPPCELKIWTKVVNAITKEPIEGLTLGLNMSKDKGYSWRLIGEPRTNSKGEVEISYMAKEETEYWFIFFNPRPNKYCSGGSDVLKISIYKHETVLMIGASPSNPALEQYFYIYGRLLDHNRNDEGINGKTIIIYEDGVKIATVTTSTLNSHAGSYEKRLKKSSTGQFKYVAEFEGDQSYKGCEEKLW